MGTRNAPGPFNCYAAALPDEEVFTVLGRDPATPATIRFWAAERERLGKVVTTDDQQRIKEALLIADRAADWRASMIELADGGDPIWRNRSDATHDDGPAIRVTPELRWGADPDEDGKLVKPLSASRICELLDYATCYGEFDENTPNGTVSKYGERMSTPMNDIRRHAIWAYKKVLGLLDEDAVPPMAAPAVSDFTVSKVATGLLQVRADLIDVMNHEGAGISDRLSQFVDRIAGYAAELALDGPVTVDPYKAFAADASRQVADEPRKIGVSPALAAPYGGKPAPTVDTAPEDLAHAPEVPAHRFSSFVKSERYAYARGLEVAPVHLPRALDAMAASGWRLLAIFGATDSQHVGFVFERDLPPRDLGFELAHGLHGGFDTSALKRHMEEPVRWPETFTGSDALDSDRYRKD